MASRSRTALVLSAAFAVIGMIAAACSSGGGGGGGGGNTPPFSVTLNGNGLGANAGKFALFRVISGGGGANVAFCTSASVGGGSPSFSFTTPAVLTTNVNYSGEVYIATNTAAGLGYANSGNPATRDPGARVAIGVLTSSVTLTLSSAAVGVPAGISWTNGLDCPG